VGFGTSLGPRLWHPTLEALEQEGLVVREEIRTKTPSGRDQVCTILRLNTSPSIVPNQG
jgi:hypothetical protein